MFHQVFEGDFDGELTVKTFINADFAAGAVLISYGAMLGRLSMVQVLWMLVFELIFYAINENIGVNVLFAVDMGGSMFVHAFGAYFGLAFSYVWGITTDSRSNNEAIYHSDMFAMIGTVFLWMYWPSFNGALAYVERDVADVSSYSQERVVVNTVISLCCSCSCAFIVSYMCNHNKFDMVHIQNATLAGGVAAGSSCDLIIGPWAAMLVGTSAGLVSVLGYQYLTDILEKRGVQDICGVHNLHGMPAIIGGVAGAIAAANASTSLYGEGIENIFEKVGNGERTATEQMTYQLAALGCSIFIGMFGGALSAMIVGILPIGKKRTPFSDIDEWEVAPFPKTYELVHDKESIKLDPTV